MSNFYIQELIIKVYYIFTNDIKYFRNILQAVTTKKAILQLLQTDGRVSIATITSDWSYKITLLSITNALVLQI